MEVEVKLSVGAKNTNESGEAGERGWVICFVLMRTSTLYTDYFLTKVKRQEQNKNISKIR